jgi:hypothetical protein
VSIFEKLLHEGKELEYVEGLRRNPQFREECDKAIKDFLQTDDYWKNELTTFPKSKASFFNSHLKSPEVIRDFMDYSPQAERLGKRWGLNEPWHYECPDFPTFKGAFIACAKIFRNITPDKINKSILDENGMLHVIINPEAPKKEIMTFVKVTIDKIRNPHSRGISTDDIKEVFKIYDMHQLGKRPWEITQELFPEVRGQAPAIDPEAKRKLKNITDALRKAKRIIQSIKPVN